MELAHEIQLAEIAASEKDKQRSFELEKLRFHSEKEKQHLPQKIDEGKKLSIQKEEVVVETIDFIPLPQNLIDRYNLCATQFLKRAGEKLNINDIAEFADEVMEIRRDIRRFITSHKIEEDEVMEYAYLKKINNILDDTADMIMRKSLNEMAYSLDEEMRKMLLWSLE